MEYSKERFFLCGYLILKIWFSLCKLLSSGNFHFSQQSCSLFILKHFSLSCVSFTFFKRSLSSKGVNISLSIGGFLLQVSKFLNFSFFFFSHNSSFFLSFILSLLFLQIVLVNIFVFLFFFTSSFVFDSFGKIISMSDCIIIFS